ncbi:MAG: cytidylyltransferase domain-containing protein [Adhaeribacter sp.]
MVTPRTGLIIQARLNSSRLPGKVLLRLPQQGDQTILDHIIARGRLVQPRPEIILATSTNQENAVLEWEANKNGIHFFRGEEEDVLARYYHAACAFELETIVRLTADNPFVDPGIISQTLRTHHLSGADYTATTGLPLGTNLEIFGFTALEKAFKQATLAEHREHVTPFLRLNPQIFNLQYQDLSQDNPGQANWRLTIDNEADYALACAILLALPVRQEPAPLAQVQELLKQNPALLTINQHQYQKKIYLSLEQELTEAKALLRLHDMPRAARILDQTSS